MIQVSDEHITSQSKSTMSLALTGATSISAQVSHLTTFPTTAFSYRGALSSLFFYFQHETLPVFGAMEEGSKMGRVGVVE